MLCFNTKFYWEGIEFLLFFFAFPWCLGSLQYIINFLYPLQLLFPKCCILRSSFQWVTMVQRNVSKEAVLKKKKKGQKNFHQYCHWSQNKWIFCDHSRCESVATLFFPHPVGILVVNTEQELYVSPNRWCNL